MGRSAARCGEMWRDTTRASWRATVAADFTPAAAAAHPDSSAGSALPVAQAQDARHAAATFAATSATAPRTCPGSGTVWVGDGCLPCVGGDGFEYRGGRGGVWYRGVGVGSGTAGVGDRRHLPRRCSHAWRERRAGAGGCASRRLGASLRRIASGRCCGLDCPRGRSLRGERGTHRGQGGGGMRSRAAMLGGEIGGDLGRYGSRAAMLGGPREYTGRGERWGRDGGEVGRDGSRARETGRYGEIWGDDGERSRI